MRAVFGLILLLIGSNVFGQTNENKFRQLGQELPTPNVYRNAAGAPGHDYWQQKADYDMAIVLDDESQIIRGEETITYFNNSPDPLTYLWVQMDQNMRAKDSDTHKIAESEIDTLMYFRPYKRLFHEFDGGFKLDYVKDAKGNDLPFTVNKTMMRVELPKQLNSGKKVTFKIKWWYNINDRMAIGGRSGYEYFPTDDNYLYTIAQFYPRMAVYSDVEGWQNKQFLGNGEFALPFGDFDVSLTVPSDHVVAATGDLKSKDVLSSAQRKRLEQASRSTDKPVMIITQDEATENEKEESSTTKTWRFKAENVRDFAFASSRKFLWDAQAVKQGDRTIMAMSYYPKEGNPLWEEYSTKAVVAALNTYSKHTFEYPYPKAISVHTKRIGMEYPMICFNWGRPEADGTYDVKTRNSMISVIIHEIGHNYFPMIVNSDERQWTWMDEGLNTFLQYLTEQEFEPGYPSRRGPAKKITNYMRGKGNDLSTVSPIMTNSESILQFGNNAYGKPATALNILRTSIMGPELFDYAFKEYANRWMFKHPSPADFFRTMEDASGVDLDWFWRGWFYTNENVDIAITDVQKFKMDTEGLPEAKKTNEVIATDIAPSQVFKLKGLTPEYREGFLERRSDFENRLLQEGRNNTFYQIDFENKGGLVMPLLLTFDYADGSVEELKIPVEIWRKGDSKNVSKVFVRKKEIVKVTLDKNEETADVNVDNNHWPAKKASSRFDDFKKRKE